MTASAGEKSTRTCSAVLPWGALNRLRTRRIPAARISAISSRRSAGVIRSGWRAFGIVPAAVLRARVVIRHHIRSSSSVHIKQELCIVQRRETYLSVDAMTAARPITA